MSGLGEATALALADIAVRVPGADAVEAVITAGESALTRYADSRIHQNTERADGHLNVRVVVDGSRVGVVSTNDLTEDGVRRATTAAIDSARLTPPDPDFAGLAQPAKYADAGIFDEPTAGCGPQARADAVAAMLAQLPTGILGSGAVETANSELAVVNSNGVQAYCRTTRASAAILAAGSNSTGYAEGMSARFADIDLEQLAERARRKVELGRDPIGVPPGDYAVVLEPLAVATIVEFLCWIAFAGRDYVEGRSPLSDRSGEQVCDPRVTIVDDGLSPLMPGMPFDFEGVPKQRVALIDKGIAAGPVHDLATAKMVGATSTGHGLPAPNPEGGIPLHPLLETGDVAIEDLIGGLERGLLVTRFHYTNVVNPMGSTITGMTRDGTFLVEDGRIQHGVHNLRFTQSILAALSGVEAIGAEAQTSSDGFFGCTRTPAIRLNRFAFTSATTF
jgi:PmbA protein